MVTTAFVNIWGKRVGAIAWDDNTQVARFEYDHFETMMEYTDVWTRIALSISAESYILSSQLSQTIKQRILITFALYRYSAYFWSLCESKGKTCWSVIWNAISEYCAMNYDWPAGFIEDGKDVYMYAAVFSAVTCAIFHCPC